MPHAFTVSAVIPASPREIYDSWLNGRRHAAMTGTSEASASTRVGGKFIVWDGYISGRNLELAPGCKIVQSWRTTEFGAEDADSRIAVSLAKSTRGTKVTLRHSNVPDTHTTYKTGWGDHYFAPMKAYFGALAAKTKPAKAKPKAKPKAAKKMAKK